jgi:hypothetical protein
MCEYCKNIFTEDDYTDLFEFPIRIAVGDTEHDLGYFSAGIVSSAESLGLTPKRNEFVIEASVLIGEMVHVKYIPIKYCPMCGQNLAQLFEMSDRR